MGRIQGDYKMNAEQIKSLMIADIQRSGLTEADAKKLKFSTAPHTLTPATAGYVIPYFDTHGKPTKFYRVRYLETTLSGFAALSGKKPLRYNQPPQSVNEVYLPPYIHWKTYLAGKGPLIITEGEKKSALATRENMPAIGLGGVWCFMSKRASAPLLPIFDEINLTEREVYICFDSDAATNPDILHAEATLARRLVERGAHVFIARIPGAKKRKVGMDDYMMQHTAAQFHRNIIAKAFEFSQSKELHEMNAEFVFLRGINSVYDYNFDLIHNPHAFVNHQYCNRHITVMTREKEPRLVQKPAAKLWMEWPHRAELTGITYRPGQPRITDSGELNSWAGWGVVDAKRGDVMPWRELLDVLFADTEPEARRWFEQWCAYPIQNPGAKMASAVVMWGASQGTGKTLCGHTLMKLYGKNATEVKDSDLEDARFAWAENRQFVLADDITGQNNRKLSNMFKTMITQKTLHINKKYVPSYTVPDCINYYFTSNDPDAFYLDDKDRRFFIHEVLSDKLPESLRKRFVAWSETMEGISALFYYLLNLDITGFDPQAAALATTAKNDMTHISKSELGVWVSRLRDEPSVLLNGKMRSDLYTAAELHILYDPLETKRASPNALARELKRSGVYKVRTKKGGQVSIDGRQLRLYAVRNADKWKAATTKEVVDHYIETHAILKEKF